MADLQVTYRDIGGLIPYVNIHRHTGGLEIVYSKLGAILAIHRHTGGLEIISIIIISSLGIHRHTGGLENK